MWANLQISGVQLVHVGQSVHPHRQAPPDVGDVLGADEYVEAHSHQLLSCEQLVGVVTGENSLQLQSPLPTIAGAVKGGGEGGREGGRDE